MDARVTFQLHVQPSPEGTGLPVLWTWLQTTPAFDKHIDMEKLVKEVGRALGNARALCKVPLPSASSVSSVSSVSVESVWACEYLAHYADVARLLHRWCEEGLLPWNEAPVPVPLPSVPVPVPVAVTCVGLDRYTLGILHRSHNSPSSSPRSVRAPAKATPAPPASPASPTASSADHDDYGVATRVGAEQWSSLYPFQQSGVEFCISRGGRALIGDEPGLGKTRLAIAACLYYRKEDWPLLIICPRAAQGHWYREWTVWGGVAKSDICLLSSSKKAAECMASSSAGESKSGPRVTIVSFKLACILSGSFLKKRKFGCVVVDESHLLKNYKSQQTRALGPLVTTSRRALYLSGTPLSRPSELYPQMSALQPDVFLPCAFSAFADRFCNKTKRWIYARGQRQCVTDCKGSANLEELHALLTSVIMIRRTKSDMLPFLPEKRRLPVSLAPASSIEEKKTTRTKKRAVEGGSGGANKKAKVSASVCVADIGKGSGGDAKEGGRGTGDYLQEFVQVCKRKIPLCCAYLSTVWIPKLLDPDDAKRTRKLVVFAHHKAMLNAIETMFDEHKIGLIRIDGDTNPKHIQPLIDAFQREDDDDKRVALLSLTCAGTSITLTAATDAIMTELHPKTDTMLQAEDRIHRIGQTRPVSIHYLKLPGSVDDATWTITQTKFENMSTVMDGEASLFL